MNVLSTMRSIGWFWGLALGGLLIDRAMGGAYLTITLFVVGLMVLEESEWLLWAVGLGLVADMFAGRWWGLSGVYFLLVVLGVWWYRQRLPEQVWWSVGLVAGLVGFGARWVWQLSWGGWDYVVVMGLSVGLWLGLRWRRRDGRGGVYVKQ